MNRRILKIFVHKRENSGNKNESKNKVKIKQLICSKLSAYEDIFWLI
jgi:hypothetical protein